MNPLICLTRKWGAKRDAWCIFDSLWSIFSTLCSYKIGVSMSSCFCGTDRISLRKMPLKPHESPPNASKWAFRAFQTRSSRGLGPFKVRSLRGFSHQKIKAMPSLILFIGCKNRVLKSIMFSRHRTTKSCYGKMPSSRYPRKGEELTYAGGGVFHFKLPVSIVLRDGGDRRYTRESANRALVIVL